MTTYTGVADANGDFTIPFSSNYTGGQKIIVTAEKDSAVKTVELFAPSTATGGVMQFSGTMANFPGNIGKITLSEDITGSIGQYAMNSTNTASMYAKATGLEIKGDVISIGSYAFSAWVSASTLALPSTLETIGQSAFFDWTSLTSLIIPDSVKSIGASAFGNCGASTLQLSINPLLTEIPSSCFTGAKFTSVVIPNNIKIIKNSSLRLMNLCTKITIGSGVTSIETAGLGGNTACMELIMLPTTPPTLVSGALGINASGVIKVPAASVDVYKAAPNWSAFAAQIQAIG